MMKSLISLMLTVGTIVLLQSSSIAQSASRQIPASYAQGRNNASLQSLKLWTGYGLTLSFIPTGEVIKKVWLDDPSQIGMDFDTVSCTTNSSNSANCMGTGATVIHLRRIVPIKFPQLLRMDGSTTLKVITRTPNNQSNLYQFRLVLSTGTPEYVTVEIVPDVVRESVAAMTQKSEFLSQVRAGLNTAEQRRQISQSQPLWKRLQNFLDLARGGMTVEQAAQQAGVSLAVIHKLAEMGTNTSIGTSLAN